MSVYIYIYMCVCVCVSVHCQAITHHFAMLLGCSLAQLSRLATCGDEHCERRVADCLAELCESPAGRDALINQSDRSALTGLLTLASGGDETSVGAMRALHLLCQARSSWKFLSHMLFFSF
jgi:hypothetical protein